jgi:hypothetical protein
MNQGCQLKTNQQDGNTPKEHAFFLRKIIAVFYILEKACHILATYLDDLFYYIKFFY